ncbi:eukaryotic translation initiation factor 3 subunit K [Paracoccidioides brasiliensis Pb03]|nr:eukaryotic translation initiation factor 3 subunit K [Paracoccidioides brasiliensis Pb03]
MAVFDKCKTRPQHIEAILNGLDRYNPETTTIFQDYVVQQCEDRTFDAYANLALLKLYQFNPHLLHTETTTNILAKALTVFPSPAFSLSLALLPAHTQPFASSKTSSLPMQTSDFVESVQKLSRLNTLLESAQYPHFWSTLNSDDLYADLVADVSGFEELVRVRIAVEVGKAFREISADILAQWLDLHGLESLEKFVVDVCGWELDKSAGPDLKSIVARVPRNKENEARGEIKGEKVGIEMFGRVLRRGFEQPA